MNRSPGIAIDNAFINALTETARAQEAGPVDVVETHISWVILTGSFAYKIKKPVNLGFLDFSTLEKRRFFCQEELRINRRLCPDIYLSVVPITGDTVRPVFEGTGNAFEYAVKMKRFDQDLLWDRLSKRGELQSRFLDELASVIAAFHQKAPAASAESPYGMPSTFWKSVEFTFEHLDQSIHAQDDRALYESIVGWMKVKYHKLAHRMIQRRSHGFVREGHGDLHLRNIALFSKADPRICVFDAIEFDDNLRWIDVINDIAFLTMDLEHRKRSDLAWRFLNAYLEITGYYTGLDLLRIYEANRALVRAKVLAIQKREEGSDEFPSEAREFLHLAESYTKPQTPCLYITHGLSGSGKTTATSKLFQTIGAARIRSDIERKRLFGLAPNASSSLELKNSMYSAEGNRRTYDHLKKLAHQILKANQTVIVDAAFLKRDLRSEFRNMASKTGADFKILDFHVKEELLRKRIQERQSARKDASEADLQVLAQQIKDQEELTTEEMGYRLDGQSARLT